MIIIKIVTVSQKGDKMRINKRGLNIIKKYEPEVDWDQKAADYARKWGKKKEDVQKEWKLNNLKSTISGTRTHSFGESYTNLLCGHPELICEQNKSQYIEEFNTMVSTYP